MDASTSPNSNFLPNFSVPPSVPQPTTNFLAPVFSQNNVLSTEETSFFNLKLDVDGCLRELRKRDLETTQVERDGMGSNKRIGWEMNFPTYSMFATASTPSPSVSRKNTVSFFPHHLFH
ncbi:uncharacterized protein A4U43_C03F11560 [Asparagus officinalis]|uniref:Uncharacterized protein n=1 Tax=Asparagus officinalis TaxID=4686 RepID=A0A5P1FDH3_ASPOF|nr:uncharacterized protein A4U43_C03F11560 [Asparagus officinalis]